MKSNIKKYLIFYFISTIFLIQTFYCYGQDIDLVDIFFNRPNFPSLANAVIDVPPDILIVYTVPQYPKKNEDVLVRAKIDTNPEMTPYKVNKAEMTYTVDGINFTTVEMKKSSDGFWEAKIPGTESNTFVQYYFSAWDEIGNAVVELPKKFNFKLTNDSIYSKAIIDPNDNIKRTQNDILSISFATDGKNIYFRKETKGKVVSQIGKEWIVLRGLGIALEVNDTRINKTFSQGTVSLDGPAIIYSQNPLMPRTGLYYLKDLLTATTPTAPLKFEIKDNVLYGKTELETLSKIPEHGIILFGATIVFNLQNQSLELDDFTPYLILYFDGHSYYVTD